METLDRVKKYLPKIDEYDYSKWLTNGCYLDLEAACNVIEFFEEELIQTMGKWAGEPVKLLDWQKYLLLVPVFGIKKADGRRRFRRFYVRIPRKNGKSTICAGIILYLLACDGEARPRVYGFAVDRQQAKIVLDECIAYVNASEFLKTEVFQTFKDRIECRTNDGVYLVLSKDTKNKDGLNASGAVGDEMHQLPDGVIVDRVHRSTSTRDQPLEGYITTAGIYSPGKETICWLMDDLAKKVEADPDYDPTLYPLLYGAEEGDNIADPKVWEKANPSLGPVKSYEYMEIECREALRNPAALNDFKRFELNIWVGSQSAWIPDADWQARAYAFTEEEMRGRVCYGGLDLSKTRDYTALVLCFPPHELDRRFSLLPYLWCPRVTFELRKDKQPILQKWYDEGHILITEGNAVDYDAVKDKIEEIRKIFRVKEIAFDNWNSSMLVNELQKNKAPMVEFRQGWKSMSPATKDFDIALSTKGNLWHNGNPAMAWMLQNVVLTKDKADNWQPDKAKSTDAIDGIVASLMAYARAWACHETNPYETRGLRSLND